MTAFSISLEAGNPERGHFRHYHLEAGRDLFGIWLVEAMRTRGFVRQLAGA